MGHRPLHPVQVPVLALLQLVLSDLSFPTQDLCVALYTIPLSLSPPSPTPPPIGASHLLSQPNSHNAVVHLSVDSPYLSLQIPFILLSRLKPPYLDVPPSLFQIFATASEHETIAFPPKPAGLRTNKHPRCPCASRLRWEIGRYSETLKVVCTPRALLLFFCWASGSVGTKGGVYSESRELSWVGWKRRNSSFLPCPGDRFCLDFRQATGDKYTYA